MHEVTAVLTNPNFLQTPSLNLSKANSNNRRDRSRLWFVTASFSAHELS
jgi:hypothetical protein